MKTILAVLMLFYLSLNAPLMAEVRIAQNVAPIFEEVKKGDGKTLFLIDIGGTLLIRKDPVLHTGHESWKNDWFQKHYPKLSFKEKVELIRIVEGKDTWFVAEDWQKLIELARSQKIKVLAFSKGLMEPSLEKARIETLKSFGLVFKDELSELPHRDEFFLYESGVIQTGEKLKGPVLKVIVSKVKEKPSKIIFVDDRSEQVESVNETCKSLGIASVAFHYTAFKEAPSLDQDVANKQLEHLVKKHEWLNVEKIRAMK